MKSETLERRPRPWARWATKAAFGALAFGLGAAAAAPKHTFTAGAKLSAQEMNENFADLEARIAKPTLTYAGSTYSVGPTKFCGASVAPANASFAAGGKVGYAAAKIVCEQTCASLSAHMCLAEEVVRSVAIGVPITREGWYSTGTEGYGPNSFTTEVIDCAGWQNASGNTFGMTWAIGGAGENRPYDRPCAESHPILCCD